MLDQSVVKSRGLCGVIYLCEMTDASSASIKKRRKAMAQPYVRATRNEDEWEIEVRQSVGKATKRAGLKKLTNPTSESIAATVEELVIAARKAHRGQGKLRDAQ